MACNNDVLVYVPTDTDDEIFTIDCGGIDELSEFFEGVRYDGRRIAQTRF